MRTEQAPKHNPEYTDEIHGQLLAEAETEQLATSPEMAAIAAQSQEIKDKLAVIAAKRDKVGDKLGNPHLRDVAKAGLGGRAVQLVNQARFSRLDNKFNNTVTELHRVDKPRADDLLNRLRQKRADLDNSAADE